MTVDFGEAALGDDIGVPTLRGPDVDAARQGRAPSRAAATASRARASPVVEEGARGDLIVTIDVAVPRHLTKEQKAAIEQLR